MKTISIETALAEIRAELTGADPRHACDPELIAAVYSVICAGEDEVVSVVTGDKTASALYRDGRVVSEDDGAAPAEFATVAWRIEDIRERMPAWSDEKCQKFLDDNADAIQVAMIDAGSDEIASLLPRE